MDARRSSWVLNVLGVGALLTLGGCGSDPSPPPAPAQGFDSELDPAITDIEFPGTNVYFGCHGTVGLYMAEDNTDAQSSPFAVPDHPECAPS